MSKSRQLSDAINSVDISESAPADAVTLDASGNLLVGKTGSDNVNAGIVLRESGAISAVRDAGDVMLLNRLTSDGEIINFRKDGTTVGSIDSYIGANLRVASVGTLYLQAASVDFGLSSGWFGPFTANDNQVDLGRITARYDDVYATNGTIQTSDRNEKQDIEELSEAEQRVALAAKALMRKFRWKDAVAEKGDDARIHFGIIAQDLQAAFEAEGLDAGRYAMFISSTWWEHEVEVPAVEAQDAVYETVTIPAVTEERLVSEAVYDDEGNEVESAVYETVVIEEERTEERLVSEAVEAKEAYTRTDTYETAEEAPEGAVERTRLGVRYSELLAFIIAAI